MPTVFDVENLKVEIEKKREESLKPEVYTNPSVASKINKDLKVMTAKVEDMARLQTSVKDIEEYIELCELEGDESMVADIDKTLENLKVEVFELYIATLLSGEYDNNNAIIKIRHHSFGWNQRNQR